MRRLTRFNKKAIQTLTTRMVLMVVAVGTALAAVSAGAATQSLYSPVIIGGRTWVQNNFLVGEAIQTREDGSGVVALPSRGQDLTHGGVAGARYWLASQARAGTLLPNGGQYYDLVAYREGQDPATTAVPLTTDTTVSRDVSSARWSLDDAHVVYYAQQLTADGTAIAARGLFVLDVDWSTATPVGSGERLVVPDLAAADHVYSAPRFVRWMSDSQRVTYYVEVGTVDAAGAYTYQERDPYVATVVGSGSGQTVRINLANVSNTVVGIFKSPIALYASPAGGDNRVALLVPVWAKAAYRYDIWTIAVPVTYAGEALTAKQITNGSNAKNMLYAENLDWSPDGVWIAYDAYPPALSNTLLYKSRSDGSGSQVTLASGSKYSYTMSLWRR